MGLNRSSLTHWGRDLGNCVERISRSGYAVQFSFSLRKSIRIRDIVNERCTISGRHSGTRQTNGGAADDDSSCHNFPTTADNSGDCYVVGSRAEFNVRPAAVCFRGNACCDRDTCRSWCSNMSIWEARNVS